jgi:hypothetical protein
MGIEDKEAVYIDGLTESQKTVIRLTISEFEKSKIEPPTG